MTRCRAVVSALVLLAALLTGVAPLASAAPKVTLSGPAGGYLDLTLTRPTYITGQDGLADGFGATQGGFAGVALVTHDKTVAITEIQVLKSAQRCAFGPSCEDATSAFPDGPFQWWSNARQRWRVPAGRYRLALLGAPDSVVTVTMHGTSLLSRSTRTTRLGSMRTVPAQQLALNATTGINLVSEESGDVGRTGSAVTGTVTRYDVVNANEMQTDYCFLPPEATLSPDPAVSCTRSPDSGTASFSFGTCAPPAPLCLPLIADELVTDLVNIGLPSTSEWQARHTVRALKAQISTELFWWNP